jgi:TonB family protein
MCRLVALFTLVVVSSAQTLQQPPLPSPSQALIIEVKFVRQSTAQGPYEFTLPSGARVSVQAKDVHDGATRLVRETMSKQATPSVDPALLFVLQLQSVAPAAKGQMLVTLLSGATVRVSASDIHDLRLTFLSTALAEAGTAEKTARAEQLRNLQTQYSEMVAAKVRENWQRNQKATGKVKIKFIVQRDGRITNIQVEESGGELLDMASMRAVMLTRQVPPIPPELPDKTLTIEVVFEYSGG